MKGRAQDLETAAATHPPVPPVEAQQTQLGDSAAKALSLVDLLAEPCAPPSTVVDCVDHFLYLLGQLAQRFLVSQGITTVDIFLASENKAMAIALLEWRKQEKLEERKFNSSMNEVRRWKCEVLQRQETRKGKLVGLHIAFEVFDPTVRSFLAAQSIATPSDLRLGHRPTLASDFISWRKEKGMKEILLSSASRVICMWKESVERQGTGLAELAASTSPISEPQEHENDTMKVNAAAQSPLIFNPLGMGRATEKVTATAATDTQPSEVLFEKEDTNIATFGMVTSIKETIDGLSCRGPIETTVDSASVDGQEQGLANGIIPNCQRKRAQDESTGTRHIKPSHKKLRYSVFWV